jgi:hypothetical protein
LENLAMKLAVRFSRQFDAASSRTNVLHDAFAPRLFEECLLLCTGQELEKPCHRVQSEWQVVDW